ncbi:serine hydrolase [Pseudalkalibacillus caeni]|nr:serine hydrolase [Pseudalkalibacillus caeni]
MRKNTVNQEGTGKSSEVKLFQLESEIKTIIKELPGDYSIVIETLEGTISLKGENQLPAASLIKLPIMIEAFRQSEANIIDLDEIVDVSTVKKVGGAGILARLSSIASLTIRDLLTLMIIVSDNTATNELIDRLSTDKINNLCRAYNCQSTRLQRKLMDFEALKNGKDNLTSSKDVVKLLKGIDTGQDYSKRTRKEMLSILSEQQFLDKLPAFIPQDSTEEFFMANKTGELPGVEHDAAIIKSNGKHVYACVMFANLYENKEGKVAISEIGRAIWEFLK